MDSDDGIFSKFTGLNEHCNSLEDRITNFFEVRSKISSVRLKFRLWGDGVSMENIEVFYRFCLENEASFDASFKSAQFQPEMTPKS